MTKLMKRAGAMFFHFSHAHNTHNLNFTSLVDILQSEAGLEAVRFKTGGALLEESHLKL